MPCQLTWARVVSERSPWVRMLGGGTAGGSHSRTTGGAANHGAARCGAAGPREMMNPRPLTAPFCRPWSCGAFGRIKLVWWLVCDASAAWCAVGSPRISATSGASWTNKMCAWWAWGQRPWACRSSWMVATSQEVRLFLDSEPWLASLPSSDHPFPGPAGTRSCVSQHLRPSPALSPACSLAGA